MMTCAALSDAEPRPPPAGSQAGRSYYAHLATRHAQWEAPLHRVLLRVTRRGYQANMAASSVRGLLGFDAGCCPPIVSDTDMQALTAQKSGAGAVGAGGKAAGVWMAETAPRITWGELKEVLTRIISGLVQVQLEYVPALEPASGGLQDSDGGESDMPAVRVSKEHEWQNLLEYLRSKAAPAPALGSSRHAPDSTEADVDLLLFKSK